MTEPTEEKDTSTPAWSKPTQKSIATKTEKSETPSKENQKGSQKGKRNVAHIKC